MNPLDDLCTQLLLDQAEEWDQPNRVFLIKRTGLGALTLEPVDLPEALGYISPRDQMSELVVAICSRLFDPGQSGVLDEDVRGVAVMYEGWEAPQGQAREAWRRHKAGGSLPPFTDMPEHREVRMLLARTIDGDTRAFRLARGNATVDQLDPAHVADTDETKSTLLQTVYILSKLSDPAHAKILHRIARLNAKNN